MNIFQELLGYTVDDRVYYATESANPELLHELALDDESMVREAVAKNTHGTNQNTLGLLAKDESWLVRLAVAYNVNTPPAVVNYLCNDSHVAVREAIKLRRENGLA